MSLMFVDFVFRMKTIREKVEEFDKNRSNKEEITSLKVVEKLNLSNRRGMC